MTGGVEIGIADIRPKMHVEITQRPWRGILTSGVEPGGRFFAVQDGADDDSPDTSWSVDVVGSIRLLDVPDPAPAAPVTVLTRDELGALPIGAVVDATVTGARVRAMRLPVGGWILAAKLDHSYFAGTTDLADAVLVTDAPLTPAPAPPLPTEPGAAVSAVVTRDDTSRRCILVRTYVEGNPWWNSGAPIAGTPFHLDEHLSDWREVRP